MRNKFWGFLFLMGCVSGIINGVLWHQPVININWIELTAIAMGFCLGSTAFGYVESIQSKESKAMDRALRKRIKQLEGQKSVLVKHLEETYGCQVMDHDLGGGKIGISVCGKIPQK